MSPRLMWVVMGTLLAAACGGGSDGGFEGPLWVETDVEVADIDGDGRQDVLTLAMRSEGGRREGHLKVYLQSAPGVFAAPLDLTVGTYPWHMAVGLVDGDARPDLVIADPDAAAIWLLRQDPAQPGHFSAPQALFDGSRYDVVIADLDHDGVPDVAAPWSATSSIRVRYQDPVARGTFGAPVDLPLPATPTQLAAADIDGDGRQDLLVWMGIAGITSPVTSGLAALFQQPDGSFTPSAQLATQTGLNARRLAVTDANGDGRPDLLAYLTPSSADYKARLVVVPQTAPRTWGAPAITTLTDVLGIDDAAFADLNGSGVTDAAVAGFWPESGGPFAAPNVRSRTNVLLNAGSGSFALTALHEMPITVSRIAAGDLDGDGRMDLVVYGDEQVMVMRQSATPGVFLPPRALR